MAKGQVRVMLCLLMLSPVVVYVHIEASVSSICLAAIALNKLFCDAFEYIVALRQMMVYYFSITITCQSDASRHQ